MLRTRRASGSRVRTEIRGSTGSAAGDPSRSVAARRTSRRRPSGSASAMNPGPRLQLADNSLSVCPNKGWPGSVTVTLETTGSKTAASRSARRPRGGDRDPGPAAAPHAPPTPPPGRAPRWTGGGRNGGSGSGPSAQRATARTEREHAPARPRAGSAGDRPQHGLPRLPRRGDGAPKLLVAQRHRHAPLRGPGRQPARRLPPPGEVGRRERPRGVAQRPQHEAGHLIPTRFETDSSVSFPRAGGLIR
jgi:hypothetical protein